MKLTIENGRATFDVCEFVRAMDDTTRTEVARYIVADEMLFGAILDYITTGQFFEDDEDGVWWLGNVTALREKLIPLMPEATRELVRDLIQQRDQATALHGKASKAYWDLYHAWPEFSRARRPEWEHGAFPAVSRPTKEQADELLKGAK